MVTGRDIQLFALLSYNVHYLHSLFLLFLSPHLNHQFYLHNSPSYGFFVSFYKLFNQVLNSLSQNIMLNRQTGKKWFLQLSTLMYIIIYTFLITGYIYLNLIYFSYKLKRLAYITIFEIKD